MNKMKNFSSLAFSSPIGMLHIEASDKGIAVLKFTSESAASANTHHAILERCKAQLQEYFSGTRTVFDLPIDISGTVFNTRIWGVLQNIPYGQVLRYGQVAQQAGSAKAARAVGMACNRNPVGIIIPCHRVIGSNGSLTGYAGGLDKKEWLLRHERSVI